MPAAAAAAVASPPATITAAEISPPKITVNVHRRGTAPGLIFVSPQSPRVENARGPQIVDDRGRPIWYRQLPEETFSSDFRVQTYQGRQVLTWWEGQLVITGTGITGGVGYIADSNYRIIATVRGPEGDSLDMHEFKLTSRGTALVTTYRTVPYDLTPIGGPKDGKLLDSVVQEIDVKTGRVLLRWSAIAHVPLTESYAETPPGEMLFDHFHVNSVDVDTDGDLLVSGANMNAIYKIDRRTGRIVWRLGGRASDFKLGDGVRFVGQHDARAVGRDMIRIFDNGKDTARVVWVRLDQRRRTASLVRELRHPDPKTVRAEGGATGLPNGNTMVGWGTAFGFSEFSRSGKLLLDASFPDGFSTYRAYRYVWKGRPATPPTVSLAGSSARVVWNGATGVARWRILTGPSQSTLKPVTQAGWNGFDTAITLPSGAQPGARFVKAEALDAHGRVIGASSVTPVQTAKS